MSTFGGDWKSRFENLIREGKGGEVRDTLSRLRAFPVDRADLAYLASIARRVGLPELTVRLLEPIVRSKFPLKNPAAPTELAVYASGLGRAGALKEGSDILRKIKHHPDPEILLFLGFNYVLQWDYVSAIAPLKKYVQHPEVTEYDKAVAKTNLAASHQFIKAGSPDVFRLVDEVIADSRRNQWTRQLRNALELRAQACMSRRDWTAAEGALDEAAKLSAADDILIRKWRAVLKLKKEGATAANLSELESVRTAAEALKDWETVRDCDNYRALETKDETLAARLYLGTSHRSFKRRLKDAAKAWIKLPATYVWTFDEPQRIFDLATGEESGGEARLKPGQALLRLLQYLASDFYRSFLLGSVFAHIYPDEFYNSETSPARVRRLVERLREWFVENRIPLEIVVEDHYLRLHFTGSYGLRLGKDVAVAPDRALLEQLIVRLRAKWPYQGFSATQAAEELELSVSRAREVLKTAEEKKKLKREGRGRATRFRFSK